MPDKTLDTKGLACPLPILKTRKVLSELPKGAKLEVLATDPGSVPDFQAFCASRPAISSSSIAKRPASTASSSSTSEEAPMAQDAVSRARHRRHEGVADLPGDHDVRRPHARGRGAAHDRPCAGERRQLHRHGQRLHRRALGGGRSAPPSRPSATAGCSPPSWRRRRGPPSPMPACRAGISCRRWRPA